MKHYNFKESSGARLRSLLLLLAFIFVGANANADVISIELGDTVTVAAKTTWSFTAPKTGTVTVEGFVVQVFKDEALTTEVATTRNNSGRGGSFSVESGVTYYLYNRSSLNAGNTFILTMAGDNLTLKSVSPESGSTFDVTGSGNLSVTFDVNVTYSSATVTAGTITKSIERTNSDGNTSLLFNLKSVINDLVSSGAVSTGDQFTVTINGICATSDNSIVYGNDGSLTLTYIVPEMPAYLVSKSIPETFLSFWDEGDASGILTLTFSKELQEGATATLSYGDKDKDADGGYYYEELSTTISGNTLTVDFTNKTRTPATMLSNDSVYSTISVKIANVKDSDGNTTYSNSSANVGSYSFTMPYQMVAASDLYWEWTPSNGSSIEYIDQLDLYISGGDYSVLHYDGVKFSYTVDGEQVETVQTVDNGGITTLSETEDELELGIVVPEDAKTASDVYVTLYNLKNLDGIERDFTVKYNGIVVELVEPTETTLDALDDKLVLWTNAEANYVNFKIVDESDGKIVWTQSGMTKEYNETKGADCYVYDFASIQKLTLYKDHTYRIYFMTSDVDQMSKFAVVDSSIVLYGSTLPYEYSEYTLTSIDPDPSSYTIDSQDAFTINVEFDGLVNINSGIAYLVDGQGSTTNFASITPTDDDATETTTYSKKWALTASASYMSSLTDLLNVSIAAEDELGRRVKGNEGTEAGSYFYYEYETAFGEEFTVIPADGSTVTKLDTIFAEYEPTISRNWNAGYENETAIVYNAAGDAVTYVTSSDVYVPADKQQDYDNWNYTPTQVYMTLATPITEPGEYTFAIPAKYLILGEEMDAPYSKAMTVHYTVAALANDFVPESIAPDTTSTSTVEELSTITLTYAEEAVLNSTVEGTITVYSKTDRSEVTTGTATVEGNTVTITLAEPITAEGTYTVVVPAGMIGNAEYGTSGYASGSCNAEYSYTYTVGSTVVEEEVVEADPAEGEVTSLSRIVLTFPNAENVMPSYNGSSIEITDANGNVVNGVSAKGDWDLNTEEDKKLYNDYLNAVPVHITGELAAGGTYTLHFPAAYFTFNDGARDSKEFSLTYTIVEPVELTLNETDTELAVTEDVTANVTLNRTLTGGEWNTFCVPFDMTDISELGKVEEFTGVTQDGDEVIMNFTEATSIEAGKPYLVKPSNDITTMTIENASIKVAEPTAVTIDGVTFIGSYVSTTVPTGAYFIYNDKLYYTDSDVLLNGFRAYITLDGSSSSKNLLYSVNGETTGINGVANNGGNVDIYTLSGVKVKAGVKASETMKGLQRGVYIVNGKKVVVK